MATTTCGRAGRHSRNPGSRIRKKAEMFSSKLATAVHILLYIEEYENEEKITSEVLSDTTGVNAVNIRKLLSLLKGAGLISVRAGIGGAYLAMPPEDISLRMIFNAVEEKDAELFRMHEHPNVNCPVGRTIKDVLSGRLGLIRKDMLDEMDQVKLSEMFRDMNARLEKDNAAAQERQ